jgi:hypothetical protein
MLTIESAEVKFDPRDFVPRMHVSFVIDLDVVRDGLDRTEDDLAAIIGSEVINQARLWAALTRSEDGWELV